MNCIDARYRQESGKLASKKYHNNETVNDGGTSYTQPRGNSNRRGIFKTVVRYIVGYATRKNDQLKDATIITYADENEEGEGPSKK